MGGGAEAERRLIPPSSSFAERLIHWQRSAGRHGFPWQRTRDPYRVWLSEVMLQQTQVSTVLPYYARFLERFPDVLALADAPQDDVLALWSGLGYYSRARNLHRCAQLIVQQHGGEFPKTSQHLAALPGIGRSTAAAIAAFCFNERAAILDGNVKRVLTRVLGFGGDLAIAGEQHRLWNVAHGLLPQRDVDVYTQGLMDLGATVCTSRRPACQQCPFEQDCVARATGRQHDYPVKSRSLKRSKRENALLWLRQGDRHYLVQRPQQGVWAGLWTLPEYPTVAALDAQACWPGQGQWMAPIEHTLTHFDWTLHTLVWTLPDRADLPAALPQGRWLDNAQALALGLPAPVRRLLAA